MADGRAERSECRDVCHDFSDLSGPALPLVYGYKAFQGGNRGVLLSQFPCLRLLWASYDPVWISLPGSASDYPPAPTAKRKRTALAGSSPFLPVGEYTRVMVAGADCLLHHYCLRICARKLGT